VEWIPPTEGLGNVKFYAAANASNGDDKETSGDRIYTTSLDVAAGAAPGPPQLSAQNPVVNGASFQPFGAGSWTTIRGTRLASTTRLWTAADLPNGSLPPLSMASASPSTTSPLSSNTSAQINVVAPDDTSSSLVVSVNNNGQIGEPPSPPSPIQPGLLHLRRQVPRATHADEFARQSDSPSPHRHHRRFRRNHHPLWRLRTTTPKIPANKLATEIGNISSSTPSPSAFARHRHLRRSSRLRPALSV
jgi:hypothetical protein